MSCLSFVQGHRPMLRGRAPAHCAVKHCLGGQKGTCKCHTACLTTAHSAGPASINCAHLVVFVLPCAWCSPCAQATSSSGHLHNMQQTHTSGCQNVAPVVNLVTHNCAVCHGTLVPLHCHAPRGPGVRKHPTIRHHRLLHVLGLHLLNQVPGLVLAPRC